MNLEKEKYSNNFSKSEFGYVEPESLLLTVLERFRVKTKDSVIITDAGRTIIQHIDTYKKLEKENKLNGKKWYEAIPWSSRHLPAFGKKLRASDIMAVKDRDSSGSVLSHYSGEEMLSFLKEIENEMGINLGIGVGKYYCHLDVDRTTPTVWYYSY